MPSLVHEACSSPRCHANLTLALASEFGADAENDVRERLQSLADGLRVLWEASPRAQLEGCAAAMRREFNASETASLDDLLVHRVLERGTGHPLLLGIVAADVGRRAGLPVGLVGHGSEQHLAHAALAEPLVADPREDFRLIDLGGLEDTVSWPTPHEVAHTVLGLIADTGEDRGEWAQRADELRRALPTPAAAV